MAVIRFPLFLIVLCAALVAQPQPTVNDPPSIADNSFLIEEAFNQEAGVIQHISSFMRLWDSKSWVYTFTEEWPFPGHERHQLSFTASVVSSGMFPENPAGFGDLALNYRYQVASKEDGKFFFAPRASLLVPTGDEGSGRGYGGVGFQTNLPFSIYLNRRLITHLNAGATFVPSAKNEFGQKAFSAGYNLGQSFIWLAHPRFNVMLETIWNDVGSVVASDKTERDRTLLISPGIRWAYNFKSGLQIVPGIGVPLGAGPSAGERGLILYLSFEHPLHPSRGN